MKSSLAPLFTNTLLCVRGGEWFEQQSAKTSQPCIIPYSTENAWFVRHDYGTHAVSLWYIIMSYPFRSNITDGSWWKLLFSRRQSDAVCQIRTYAISKSKHHHDAYTIHVLRIVRDSGESNANSHYNNHWVKREIKEKHLERLSRAVLAVYEVNV